MQAYWSWRRQHTLSDRLPHGESPDDAFRRYANALRSLLARTEAVTLVVLHEAALRYIALAAEPRRVMLARRGCRQRDSVSVR